MSCEKCESKYTSFRFYEFRELEKGSPSKGPNKRWKVVKVKEESCAQCGTVTKQYS